MPHLHDGNQQRIITHFFPGELVGLRLGMLRLNSKHYCAYLRVASGLEWATAPTPRVKPTAKEAIQPLSWAAHTG